MAQKAQIKSRIKSINATKKITGAMKLIASVKLQKERNKMLKNREYTNILNDTMSKILSSDIDVENVFLKRKDNEKKFVIVFLSDLGLCGGYNLNITKFVSSNVSKDDYVYVVGTKEANFFKKNNYNLLSEEIYSDSMNYMQIKKIADRAIDMYKNNEVGSIVIIYTHFVNNVSFEPMLTKVLPCSMKNENEKDNVETLLEPNANEILNELIPMYVENEFYAKWLESKTSEQGSRRFAMENATDNAQELTDELLLAYNQARQAAITQEITEIIGGASAL